MMQKDTPALPQIGAAPPPPPVFGQNPANKKPKSQSMQPSFLGTGATPTQGQLGAKTLLGQ